MKLVLISGLSGSGKSVALKTLEDSGFYCVDNLPLGLLDAFGEKITTEDYHPYTRFAVCIDARNQVGELERFDEIVTSLRSRQIKVEILFLQTSDESIIRRFSETRRKHPLSGDSLPLQSAIQAERNLIEPLLRSSNLTIDTSHTNVHQLRSLIKQRVTEKQEGLHILVESFGFKNGVPIDCDFIFDVRCLPNPHWSKDLRPLTGRDQPVIEFLEKQPPVKEMYQDILDYFIKWVPCFTADNRHYLTIAIGCTGGHHRSVYLSERLARDLSRKYPQVSVKHRELS